MASLLDRGDSYHVIYLGSSMLAQVSTGLGVVQRPLRELYFKYRQAGGGPAAQERYITMSPRGMTMTYRDASSSRPTELFYAMPSILFWDAVQFITVRGSSGDKKIRGAFEPLDNDHSRNKDNLFSVLEKKYHFLQQMTHPPLFCCVLRRTAGVKALDVHAFVCSGDEEALSLVRALNTVQSTYKSDEVQETGVFGYRPFTSSTAGGEEDGRDSVRWRNVGLGSVDRAAGGRGLPVNQLAHAAAAAAAGQRTVPHKSQSALALSSNPGILSPTSSHSPRVYQLTQQDFHGGGETERADLEDEEDGYAYLTHIEKKIRPTSSASPIPPPRSVGVVGGQPRGVREGYAGSLGHQDKPKWDNSALSSSPSESYYRPQPKPRASVAARQSRLGQGYSLLTGSGGSVSGSLDSREVPHSLDTPPRPRPRSPRYQDSSEGISLPHRGVYKDYEDNRDSSKDNNTPRRAPVRPQVLSQSSHDLRSPERESVKSPRGSESPFDSPRRLGSPSKGGVDTPEPPPRPVAKVPPHKVTGVKVLPSGPIMPRRASPDDSPGDRPKSSLGGSEDRLYASPHRKTKSHFFGGGDSGNNTAEKPHKSKYKDNWQFNKPDQGSQDYEYKTLSPEEKAGGADTDHMGEKLLLSKKKDAEIASVMQDLRFEYDGRTISPGMPAGNNFEKSLGYFP